MNDDSKKKFIKTELMEDFLNKQRAIQKKRSNPKDVTKCVYKQTNINNNNEKTSFLLLLFMFYLHFHPSNIFLPYTPKKKNENKKKEEEKKAIQYKIESK